MDVRGGIVDSGTKDDNMELKGRKKRGRLQGRLMDVNEDMQRVVVTEDDRDKVKGRQIVSYGGRSRKKKKKVCTCPETADKKLLTN